MAKAEFRKVTYVAFVGGIIGGAACYFVLQLPVVMAQGQTGPMLNDKNKTPVHKHVVAEAFILVDPKGRERATLTTEANGVSHLSFWSDSGKPLAQIGIDSDEKGNQSGFVHIRSPKSEGIITLGHTPNGAAGLTMLDASGNVGVFLSLQPHGDPGLMLKDRKAGLMAIVASLEPSVSLTDKVGTVRYLKPAP